MIPDCAGTVMNYNWIPISATPTSLIFQEMQTCKIHHPWLMVISCHLSSLSTFIHIYPLSQDHPSSTHTSIRLITLWLFDSSLWLAVLKVISSSLREITRDKWQNHGNKLHKLENYSYIYILYQRKKTNKNMIKMGEYYENYSYYSY